MNSDIISAFITSVIGGLLVGILNHFFTRNKTNAEIEKIQEETKNIQVQTRLLVIQEMEKLTSVVKERLPETTEEVIYDGTVSCERIDFKIIKGRIWSNEENNYIGNPSKGEFSVKNGIINVERSNIDGRFEIWLEKYMYEDAKFDYLPKNERISGKRRLRVSCEVKVSQNSEHTLRIVIKDTQVAPLKASFQKTISSDKWKPVDEVLYFSPAIDCQIRIEDMVNSKIPGSLQIRNLKVSERII